MEKRTAKKLPVQRTETPEEETKQQDDNSSAYWQFRLPKFKFRNSSLNVYLVFVLIVFAFLLGMLVNKVMYLENELKNNKAPAADTAQQAGAQPTAPPFAEVSEGKLAPKGEDDAKVTIVEFGDFQCPFCQKYLQEAGAQVNDNYIKSGKARLVWRHYPLTSIHPNAFKASEASECANEQDQFWAYHDLLYNNQAGWSNQSTTDVIDSFVSYAEELGLNADQFRSCLDTQKYKKRVEEDIADGNKAQVDGTPTFFVNGFRVVGAVPFSDPAGGPDLKKPIEDALAK